jgi:hypothetical protein
LQLSQCNFPEPAVAALFRSCETSIVVAVFAAE